MPVNNGKVTRFFFLAISIYFIFFFLSVLLIINPEQSYFIQQPMFLFDKYFLFGYLKYPGGLIEYFSLFLSQFYFYRLTGASIITVTALAVLLFTYKILKYFNFDRFTLLLPLAPVTALLYLHSFSNGILTTSLVLLFTLVFFFYFLHLSEKTTYVRFIGYLVSSSVLFYLAGGGGFLLFQVLCLCSECLRFNKKRSYPVILIILLSSLIPYLAARYLFYITLEQSYLYILIPEGYYRPKFVLYILYIYYPLLILFSTIKPKENKVTEANKITGVTSCIIQVVIAGMVTFLSFGSSLRSEDTFISKIKYLAYKGRWDKILEVTQKRHSKDRVVNFNNNRALYFTDRLPYDLFRHLNFWGQHALFLGGHAGGSLLMDNSELYFDLGHIRAARQWAYEAQTIFENSPRVLKMLAITNVIEGDYKAADMMLNILDKSVIYKKWARYYLNGIRDTTVFQSDSLIQEKRGMMPSDIYFMDGKNVEVDLLALLKKNPKNKMAFEFLMAYLMLSDKIEKLDLADEIFYLKQLEYKEIPETYQEALMIYLARKGLNNYDLGGYEISQIIVNGYTDYTVILGIYNMNLQAAEKELYTKYGLSYWYYLNYISPMINDREFQKKMFEQ
jgi:hypothetical protein